MKVELHSNGKIQIELTPEDAIEAAYVDTFVEGAVKGRVVSAAGGDMGHKEARSLVLSIEK